MLMRVSCPWWGPTLYPERREEAQAPRGPELELAGWKIMIITSFDSSFLNVYIAHTYFNV